MSDETPNDKPQFDINAWSSAYESASDEGSVEPTDWKGVVQKAVDQVNANNPDVSTTQGFWTFRDGC